MPNIILHRKNQLLHKFIASWPFQLLRLPSDSFLPKREGWKPLFCNSRISILNLFNEIAWSLNQNHYILGQSRQKSSPKHSSIINCLFDTMFKCPLAINNNVVTWTSQNNSAIMCKQQRIVLVTLSNNTRGYTKQLLIIASLLKAVSKGNLGLFIMSRKLDIRTQSHEMGCRVFSTTAPKELTANGLHYWFQTFKFNLNIVDHPTVNTWTREPVRNEAIWLVYFLQVHVLTCSLLDDLQYSN